MTPWKRPGMKTRYKPGPLERKIDNIRRNPELNGLFSKLTTLERKSDAEAVEIIARIAKEKGIKW